MRIAAQDSGFTLVELLIAVSLISIMTGVMLPGFSNYIEGQNIRQAQEQVKNDLRSAQNKALTGVRATEVGVEYWGIRFNDNSENYTTFSTATVTDCENMNNTRTSEKMMGDAIIRNGDKCVLFSIRNGDTFFINGTSGAAVSCNDGDANSCMVSVGASGDSGNECFGVKVNSVGLIRKVSDVQCE